MGILAKSFSMSLPPGFRLPHSGFCLLGDLEMCLKMILSFSPAHRRQRAQALRMCRVPQGSDLRCGNWQRNPLDTLTGSSSPKRCPQGWSPPLLCSCSLLSTLWQNPLIFCQKPSLLPSPLFWALALDPSILFLPNLVAFHLPLQELVPTRVAKVLFVLFLNLRPFWAGFKLFSWHTARRSQMKGQILHAHCFSLAKPRSVPSLLHIPLQHWHHTCPWNLCRDLALHLLALLRDLQPFLWTFP